MTDYCVIVFPSTHAAMTAQRLLEGVCDLQVMPVLREISSGCGIALRLLPDALEAARAALGASPLSPAEYAFYGVTGTGLSIQATPIA